MDLGIGGRPVRPGRRWPYHITMRHRISLAAILWAVPCAAQQPEPPARADLAAVPLSFAANVGQFADDVRFVAQVAGAAVAFADGEVRCRLGDRPIAVQFPGALPGAGPVGEGRQPHVSHFYLSADRERWRSHVPNFAAVRYAGIYPGIDLVYTGDGRQLKYDFVVAAGGEPERIRVAYQGVERIELGESGELVVWLPGGHVIEQPPVAWQELDGRRVPVTVRYLLHDGTTFGFAVAGEWRRDLELVIDPVLKYSTYLGGASFDQVGDIAVDAAGSAYVTGGTLSPDFPASGSPVPGSDYVAFVAKLDPNGTALVYSVFLGGSSHQVGYGIALDGTRAVVVGSTSSADFPVTVGAYDTTFNSTNAWDTDAFVARLGSSGALDYATFLGGSSADHAFAVAASPGDIVTLVGESWSADFPTSVGALQPGFGGQKDVVVTRLRLASQGGADLIYSTYLGGSGYEEASRLALDGLHTIYLAGATASAGFPTTYSGAAGGFDALVARIRPLGGGASDLVWSRRLGGSGGDYASAVSLVAGDVAVAGVTYSAGFPTTTGCLQPAFGGGSSDGFVARIAGTGGSVAFSTFLGGAGNDRVVDLHTLGNGSLLAFGYTASAGFPVTSGAIDPTHNGGDDWHVSVLNGVGTTLTWSSFFGGSGNDTAVAAAVAANGDWYFAGNGTSQDFPVTAGCYDPSFNGPPIDVNITRLNQSPVKWIGTGSATSFGVAPSLAFAGAPQIGNVAAAVEAAGLVPGSLAFLAMGWPAPTPLPLQPLGGPPGATSYLTIVGTAVLVADAAGAATLPLPIPAAAGLVGSEFSFQVFDVDGGLPWPLPLACSDVMTVPIWP